MGGAISTCAEDLELDDGKQFLRQIGLSQYACRLTEATLRHVRDWSSGFGYEAQELYDHLDELGVSYADHRLKLVAELRKALALLESHEGGSTRRRP